MNHKAVIGAVLSSVDNEFITRQRSEDTNRGHFAAVVCLRKNEMLLVSKPKCEGSYSSDWLFPGGEQKVGETLIETAHRELGEETNLSADQLLPVTCWQVTTSGREHKKMFFLCTEASLSGDLAEPKVDEDIDRAEWFSLQAMLYRLPPAHREVIDVIIGKCKLAAFTKGLPEEFGLALSSPV